MNQDREMNINFSKSAHTSATSSNNMAQDKKNKKYIDICKLNLADIEKQIIADLEKDKNQ